MPFQVYKVLHLSGLILLFLAWGAILVDPLRGRNGVRSRSTLSPRLAMICHGVALLLLAVAGFGMLARMGIHWPWPGWVWAKALIWLALGGLPALVKRRPSLASSFWWVIALLGTAAAGIAVYKPF